MKPFIHDDFLLQSNRSRQLFHEFAKSEPIFDYHCHLPPEQIARNHTFTDLFEIWLAGDHYKWRAMRANGVPETLVTGDAPVRAKFDAWCATVPHTLRNPLYHWSHLELARYFDIHEPINLQSAASIWKNANQQLPSLTVHEILARNSVRVICTTDDPADPLQHHEAIKQTNLQTKVYPTFRPDAAFAVDVPDRLRAWVQKLSVTTGQRIGTWEQFIGALKSRHDAFHAFGCRLSDHGLTAAFAEECYEAGAAKVFQSALSGTPASREDRARYASYLMLQFGRWDAARGWTKQLHLGALRNTNSRGFARLGADAGFDTIGDEAQIGSLARYLDRLDRTDELPRIIVYNLNPADNYAFAALIGCFQDGTLPGKIQFGSGWWFLDQREGIEWQLNALSANGLLSRFVGMLTDSRSFLSYTRHEYFRRILCDLLGTEMERGSLPDDLSLVGDLVKRVCYRNAAEYFTFAS
ncbi:MAG: glucuronate isomerase [Opitutaceae bacterium]|nr:glucuronate isomerase [Opitutaceae bacterium]